MDTLIFRFLFLITLLPIVTWGQAGPVHIIDSSAGSTGVSEMVPVDLNRDGYEDIIASFTGSNGKLAYYLNDRGSGFSAMNIVDTIPFTKGVATGDFNKDGWPDLVSIDWFDFAVRVYMSDSGIFQEGVLIDSAISIGVNDVEVFDFDGSGLDDMVVIGQHSIDFHRNKGDGTFTKEEILTTDTSPLPLECLDLCQADVNNDGHMDLICAETIGLVIYTYSGNGVFSPHYYSTQPEVVRLVHPVDIDGDNDTDVLMKNAAGQLKWFSNNGNGVMTFESVITSAPELHSFLSIDANNDGLQDIYATYLHHVSLFLNDAGHLFNSEIPLYQDNSLYMDAVCIADIDKNGSKDYLWSGMTNTIAYHLSTNSVGIEQTVSAPSFTIYPNPGSDHIAIHSSFPKEIDVEIISTNGQLIKEYSGVFPGEKLDISSLFRGVYFLRIRTIDSVYSSRLMVK